MYYRKLVFYIIIALLPISVRAEEASLSESCTLMGIVISGMAIDLSNGNRAEYNRTLAGANQNGGAEVAANFDHYARLLAPYHLPKIPGSQYWAAACFDGWSDKYLADTVRVGALKCRSDEGCHADVLYGARTRHKKGE